MTRTPSLAQVRGTPLPFARVMLALTGIYVSQTLVSGLTFQGIPTWMRAQGTSLDAIGLISLAMLPWALKFIWAPAVERYRLPIGSVSRRSRRIVVAGQTAIVALLLGVAAAGGGSQTIVLVCLVLAALAASTVDIAADAFAVEQLSDENRGWGNTAQVGGSYLGSVFGGGLFLMIAGWSGWSAAALAMAGLVLLFSLPFWLTPEPARRVGDDLTHRPSLVFALRRPEVIGGLAVTLVFSLGPKFCLVLTGPLLIDAGLDTAAVGALLGSIGVGAGIVGTFMGGALVRLVGFSRALVTAAVIQAAALTLLAVATQAGLRDNALLVGLVLFKTLAMAIGFVALYSLLMSLSSTLQAGVDFTLFQCADALLLALAGAGSGALAQRGGYGATFALAAGISVVAAIALPLLLDRLLRAAIPYRAG